MTFAGSRRLEETYVFPSGVALRVRSSQTDLIAHFRAEYGAPVPEHPEPPDIDVYAGKEAVESSPHPRILENGYQASYKILRWRVGIADLEERTTVVGFEGSGQMVISFLQTFYIEPLLRPKFAVRDHALVHAACLVRDGTSVLFPAGSRVGKSTLALQHAAAGHPVQGDNYVILAPDGRTLAFPRRMRVYSDLAKTAPLVFTRLPAAEQRRLRLNGLIKRLSAGYSNQPRRLTIQQMLSGTPACPEARLRAVYLLKPYSGEALSGPELRSADAAIERIQEVNGLEAKQLREALREMRGEPAEAMTPEMAAREREVLSQALEGVPVSELLVPRVKDPAPVVAEMRRLTGLNGAG
jgi:hypothetical protein